MTAVSKPDPRLLAVLDRLDLADRFAEAHGPDGSTERKLAAWSDLAIMLLHAHAPEFRRGGRKREQWLTDAEMTEVFRAGVQSGAGLLPVLLWPDKIAQAWLLRAVDHYKGRLPTKTLTRPEVARRELPRRFQSIQKPDALRQKVSAARKAVGDQLDLFLPVSTYRLLRGAFGNPAATSPDKPDQA